MQGFRLSHLTRSAQVFTGSAPLANIDAALKESVILIVEIACHRQSRADAVRRYRGVRNRFTQTGISVQISARPASDRLKFGDDRTQPMTD